MQTETDGRLDLSEKESQNDVEEEHVFPDLGGSFKAVLLVLTMTFTMILNGIAIQSVTISIQPIGIDLDVPLPSYQWLTSSYSVAFASVLLLGGRLADIHGHKLAFLFGVGWFGVWSVATGFSPNEIAMDLFRAMQGVGMGAAIPSALGILGSSFPPSQTKSTAFATFSAGAPIGGCLGAVLGGFLTQYAPVTWRASFFVSSGFAALVFISAFFFVPRDPPQTVGEDRSVDWIGAFLITSGLVLLTFALADGSSAPKGWRAPYIPTLFSVSIVLLFVFWFWERYLEKKGKLMPLMRTSLWFKGKFALVQLIAALGWTAFIAFIFLSTVYYETYREYTPVQATVRWLPAPVAGVAINVVFALLASRVSAQYLIIFGGIGTGLAPLLFAVQDPKAVYWRYQFPAMILSVFGADFVFASGTMYVSQVAGPGQQALAGGIFNMVTQIGSAFGLAIMTVIQNEVTASEVRALGGTYNAFSADVPKQAVAKGLKMAFYGCTAFAFTAAILAATTLIGIGAVGHRAAVIKEESGDNTA